MRVEHAVLTAIASPRRREILRLVWSEEMAAGDIAAAMPDVTFGAVSLQLRTLQAAGLVVCRADQKHRFYKANREVLGPVGKSLERMWGDALWRLKLAAQLEASRRGPAPGRKHRQHPKPH
jgi:DNA-binding transcriptional ArsR family regulator